MAGNAANKRVRNSEADTDRTQKWFMVPRMEIANNENNFDLSLSRYKQDMFEEMHYDPPAVILDRLLKAEAGEASSADLAKFQGGIVRELLELRGMV